ncbi:MAG TPA: hypothetical protein VNF50_03955 [Acidimicrobiales bacterium]|nr:hypothetical protein [Acidimicrobiales bacterium]
MINLLYVGLAVAVTGLGSLIMVLRNRRPRSLQSGVEEFARELRALAPEPPPSARSRRR